MERKVAGRVVWDGVSSCYVPLRKLELSSTSCNASRAQKILRDNPCYTVQFSGNFIVSRKVVSDEVGGCFLAVILSICSGQKHKVK